MASKKMRVEGFGIQRIPYPPKYKGRKVTPYIYKVRSDMNGNPIITVALNYQDKGKTKLWKNLILKGR